MKKSEILRGRDLFKQVARTGKKIDGRLLRCTFLMNTLGDSAFQVAFKVPSRNINAVRRNRLRRLMREAVTHEREGLDAVLSESSRCVAMILFYKSPKDVVVERIQLPSVRRDVQEFFRAITTALT